MSQPPRFLSKTLLPKRMTQKRMRDVMSGMSFRVNHPRNPTGEKSSDEDVTYVDLTIQFIGASGIPRMDVVGSADPYFIANLDGHISIV